MLTLINNIIDRCFFTATFILGIQLPEFMQQYQQRLAGHLAEAQSQLAQFHVIAKQHFNGNLVTMISSYKNNSEPSIISSGELIERLSLRVEYLSEHFIQINQTDYLQRLYQFIWHMDKQMVADTAGQFSMAIPLELNAIATGAIIAISALVLKALTISVIKYSFKISKQAAT